MKTWGKWATQWEEWAEGENQPRCVFVLFFFYNFCFISKSKFKLNSNSGFNFQVSNIKPNSNYSITCTEIIYLLLLFIILSIV
jgi:hypothetical protein